MKKKIIILLLLMASLFAMGSLMAQNSDQIDEQAQVESTQPQSEDSSVAEDDYIEEAKDMGAFEKMARALVGSGLVDLFIQGGFAMWPMLLLLIWAIGTIIWKLISLAYANNNIKNILSHIIPLIQEKKFKEASEFCSDQRGPVAAIIAVGLQKAHKGVDAVEKTIDNAAALEMAYLEKGFNPLATTITLAPMFGFFGTLVGMIQAFDAIAAAGEVDPTIVADGIKVALITSAAGLAIAIPVQFFNNIFQTMCDNLIIDMQLTSEKVVEALVEIKGE